MLASLLPGLRDVRTPLTVGYLWLLFAWLKWADEVPRQRPSGDGLVARAFDLGSILGATAVVAALSFIAYILGALLTISTDNRLLVNLAGRLPRFSADLKHTAYEYDRAVRKAIAAQVGKVAPEDAVPTARVLWELSVPRGSIAWRLAFFMRWRHVDETDLPIVHDRNELALLRYAALFLRNEARDNDSPLPKRDPLDESFIKRDPLLGNRGRELWASVSDLRARLLVANQELYGEYDRLAAEASFRINLYLPLCALSTLIGQEYGDYSWWALIPGIAATGLAVQGLTKLALSLNVIRRAVIEKEIMHPGSASVAEWIERIQDDLIEKQEKQRVERLEEKQRVERLEVAGDLTEDQRA